MKEHERTIKNPTHALWLFAMEKVLPPGWSQMGAIASKGQPAQVVAVVVVVTA